MTWMNNIHRQSASYCFEQKNLNATVSCFSDGISSITCFLFVMQAAGRHESLTAMNMERKAKLKQEYQREGEAAIALTEKAQ